MLLYVLGMQLSLTRRSDTETNMTSGGGYPLFAGACNYPCYGSACLVLVRKEILKTLLNRISMASLGKSDKRNSY